MPAAGRILAVNPGSTSIALALYEDGQCTLNFTVSAEACTLGGPGSEPDAVAKLGRRIWRQLQDQGTGQLDAVCTRGSCSTPVSDDALRDPIFVVTQGPDEDLKPAGDDDGNEQADDLSRRLTVELARHCRCTGLIVASGRIERLRIRAGARRAALNLGRPVDLLNIVVAHLGPDVTIAGVRAGRIALHTHAWSDPEAPDQHGHGPLPAGEPDDDKGLYAYIKDQGWPAVEQRMAKGDTQLQRLLENMVLHIAQKIGGAFVAADCIVEAIVLTGEWMQSAWVRNALRKKVVRLAPVQMCQGSMEMEGLAGDAQDLLSGRAQAQTVTGHGKEIERD